MDDLFIHSLSYVPRITKVAAIEEELKDTDRIVKEAKSKISEAQ